MDLLEDTYSLNDTEVIESLFTPYTRPLCACIYRDIRTQQGIRQDTAKMIQTILDFPFHKSENQFYVKILLKSLL